MTITIPKANESVVNAQDYFFNAQALANAGAVDSTAFKFGGVLGGVELFLKADTEIVVGAGGLTVELLHSDTEDGTFTVAKQLASFASETVAAEAELAREIAETTVKQWAKVRVTSTEDLSADTVTGNIKAIR